MEQSNSSADEHRQSDGQEEIAEHKVSDAVSDAASSVDVVLEDPGYTEQPMCWQGIELNIRYNPRWLGNSSGIHIHHIEVISENREPLPITETGYRSIFLTSENPLSEYANDPLVFVHDYLDHEASKPALRRHVEASRQLSLF